MKVLKWLDDHFEETLLVILLVLIACINMWQVIVRNLEFIDPLTWAEEFSRFCWIASVFLSLPYTIRRGSMLRVSVLLDLMPNAMRNTINILVDIITMASMAMLLWFSFECVGNQITRGETSPAMLWPMWTVYSTMIVGFGLGVLRGLQMTVIHVLHFKERELTTIEQTMAEAAEEAAAGKRAEGGEA